MTRDVLYVCPHQDQWEVRSEGDEGDTDFQRHDSKEAAIDVALLSAENSQKRGRTAQVLVRDEPDGDFRVERTFAPG